MARSKAAQKTGEHGLTGQAFGIEHLRMQRIVPQIAGVRHALHAAEQPLEQGEKFGARLDTVITARRGVGQQSGHQRDV